MKLKLCISLFLAITLCATAQDTPGKERLFMDLLQSRSQISAKLDDTENRLSKLADKIDAAKNAVPQDKDHIRRLMASGIPVSDSLAEGRSELKMLDKEIAGMQSDLVRLYKGQLDSLKNLLNSGNDAERADLQNRVELISQKYMLLNPAIRQLSFNPAKLKEIELSQIADPVERDILSTFLKKSLLEVESRIEHIRSDLQEIEPFVKLNEKTREFLEEVDGDNFLLLGSTESGVNAMDEFQSNQGARTDGLTETFIEQNAFSIDQLMNQLDISDFSPEKTTDSEGHSFQPRFSSGDYLNLLREIEEQLKSVQSEIRNRLKEVSP